RAPGRGEPRGRGAPARPPTRAPPATRRGPGCPTRPCPSSSILPVRVDATPPAGARQARTFTEPRSVEAYPPRRSTDMPRHLFLTPVLLLLASPLTAQGPKETKSALETDPSGWVDLLAGDNARMWKRVP